MIRFRKEGRMRASIFEDELPTPEDVRAVAEGTAFKSREGGERKPHTWRTGRTAAFSVKTTPETVDLIYAIAERKAGRSAKRSKKRWRL